MSEINCPDCGSPMVIDSWGGWVWTCFHCDHIGRHATDDEVKEDEKRQAKKCGNNGLDDNPRGKDTERLNFLLQFLSIEDVGDEERVMGTCVDQDRMEHALQYGVCTAKTDDLRTIIDWAIEEQKKKQEPSRATPRNGNDEKTKNGSILDGQDQNFFQTGIRIRFKTEIRF